MAEGIILAGGKSTRMKTNKMLLMYQNKPIILHTIESMMPFVSRVIVVTGRYDQEIREALKGIDNITIVTNHDYEKGMFSSVLTGVKEIKDDFFVLPGDCPFVSKETFIALLNNHEDVRYPRYHNQDGHPLYISKKYKQELLSMSLDNNLKVFRDSKKCGIINTEDKNIVNNLNTILDFNKL